MNLNPLTVVFLIFPFLALGQATEDLPYIQNDAFVENTFGFPATIQNFKKNYGSIFSISKKPERNIHNKAVVDTVFTFSSGQTKIKIYKARHTEILQYVYIDTNKIPLKYNIKIGDAKADVAKKLKTKIAADKVQVGDLEQGQVYTFTFSKGKLAVISYEGYVD